MSNFLALALLVIMALLLLVCVKKLFPSAVKIIYIILICIICCFMVYLIWYLIGHVSFGSMGSPAQETEEQSSIEITLTAEKLENSIVLEGDTILIDGNPIDDMNFVEEYIEQRANDDVTVVIVDNYSLASLHHQITEICREKGANPRLVYYEDWINE